jgi:hypothetical protein
MSGVVGVFPLLVVLATIVLAILLFRLDRRLSRGALNAGPRDPVTAEPPGLLRTPWELRAIDDQLRSSPGTRNRADLVKTINRLITAAGMTEPAARLPFDATDHEIATVMAELERRLELGPLPPTGHPRPLGSSRP